MNIRSILHASRFHVVVMIDARRGRASMSQRKPWTNETSGTQTEPQGRLPR